MLRRNTTANLRVFVVWEPVLVTDWSHPDASITSNVPDARAQHWWDHDRRLSALLGGPGNVANVAAKTDIQFRMKDVIWDTALVYAPGVQWKSTARWMVAPVYKFGEVLPGS